MIKKKSFEKLKGDHDVSFARMSVLDSITGKMILSMVCTTCFSGNYKSRHVSLQQEEANCHFKHFSGPAELIPLHKKYQHG